MQKFTNSFYQVVVYLHSVSIKVVFLYHLLNLESKALKLLLMGEGKGAASTGVFISFNFSRQEHASNVWVNIKARLLPVLTVEKKIRAVVILSFLNEVTVAWLISAKWPCIFLSRNKHSSPTITVGGYCPILEYHLGIMQAPMDKYTSLRPTTS